MRHFHDIQPSPYSVRQIFALVLDIERYPEFLPWCRAARILERGDGRMLAELVVSFKHVTERYVSEVSFTPPGDDEDTGSIDVKMVRGPFSHLENHWKFFPQSVGSEIHLDLSFQFRSALLDAIIGLLFQNASAKMVRAFQERAVALYGKKVDFPFQL